MKKKHPPTDLEVITPLFNLLIEKLYEPIDKEDEKKYHEEIELQLPKEKRVEYAKGQASFVRPYNRGCMVVIRTSFNDKTKKFAPKNFCGFWIVVLDRSNKISLLHQIWRTETFIKRAMADVHGVDYLLRHVPLDPLGTRMHLYRKRADYTVWKTDKSFQTRYEKSLTETLPGNDIWWVPIFKKWLKYKQYYETSDRREKLGVTKRHRRKAKIGNKNAL
jgi:hypothetical protein